MRKKIINKPFKKFNTIGRAEIKSVENVLKSGVLSNFLASRGLNMFGGKKVLEFEKKIKKKIQCQICFNI